MRAPTSAAADEEVGLREVALWSAPLIVLFVAWLWTAFWRGGSDPGDWLPGALLVGVVGVVVGALIAYPRRPRQLSLVILALLGLYTLWVAASSLWAASPSRVWLEAERTSFLLLVFALALVYLTDPRARSLFRYLLMAAALVLLAACIWRLWTTQEIGLLFQDGRLSFPTGYPNGSAALFLIAFWPLMWLAAGPAERAPIRGVALGLATGLVTVAVMTQSRAAIYSLIVTLVIVFVISPIRLRTLLYLIVPGLLLTYAFPLLDRYWLEGPEAVGGGVAARTLLVATLAGTFMGMIVALLEQWIPASKRMKAIFGTIVLARRSRRGRLRRGRTHPEQRRPLGVALSFLAPVRLGGGHLPGARRRLAAYHRQLERGRGHLEDGLAGVRIRARGGRGGRQLHLGLRPAPQRRSLEPGGGSFPAATGAGRDRDGGGSLVALGILLSLGGLLWGRSTAAWRHARQKWLRLPGRALMSGEGSRCEGSRCEGSRFCNARWGEDARAYGWEMAVLAALAYWLIHAGFDRLWQITAVAIPALLLLAAGLAATEARVGTMWPRWEKWLRVGARGGEDDAEADDGEAVLEVAPVLRRREPEPGDSGVFGVRRTDQHVAKWRRRRRREARKQRSVERLRPAGLLSQTFRIVLLTVSVLVIIGAVPPYLSLQFQRSARALAETDGVDAAARASTAAWLWPGDPGPFATQAAIYAAAAAGRPAAGVPAVLDDLALSLAAYERAADREPAAWSLRYRAGIAALNMMIVASGAAVPGDALPDTRYTAWLASVPGLQDWTWLTEEQAGAGTIGEIDGSLWPPYGAPDSAHLYRTMTPAQLADVALAFLLEAHERNPGAPEVNAAITLVRQLGG